MTESQNPYLAQTVYDEQDRLCIVETPDPSWDGTATRVWYDPETGEELATEQVDAFPNIWLEANQRAAALEEARVYAESLPADDLSRNLILALLPQSEGATP